MFNFKLQIPTEFHFGKNCEKEVGKTVKRYGDRALVIYGSERILKNGIGNDILKSLENEGVEAHLFGGVVPNPLKSHITKAIELCEEKNINVLLAIGGGSVMDSAKGIASGQGKGTLPIVTVVTSPATSSESNPLYVLTDDDTHEKNMYFNPEVIPKAAFLNPELTYSLTAGQTAVGCFDAFSHAMERFFDLNRKSALLDKLTASVMSSIVKVLPKTLKNPNSYENRTDLMLAATIAHNDVLGPGGDFGCHEISHAVTELFDFPHGAALAVVIPAWMEYFIKDERARFADFARLVFDIKNEDNLIASEAGLKSLKSFIGEIGLDMKLLRSDIGEEEFADAVLKGRDFVGGAFKALGREEIQAIYKKMIN